MVGLTSALLTYLVHAVVWAVLGLCGGRLVGDSLRFQSACYKSALFGPFLSVALALSWRNPGEAGSFEEAVWLSGAVPRVSEAGVNVSGVLLLLLLAIGTLRFVLMSYRRAAELRGRAVVSDGAMWRKLQVVRARSSLRETRLSLSPRLKSPLVVGRAEICIPSFLPQVLNEQQLAAVFAHELSHLERGDGVWFVLVGLLESCCWFQPLNRVLARRFRASAELACDERALELGVDARALAQALVRVAAHSVELRETGPLPAMARSREDIARRLQRLLGHRESRLGARTAPALLALLFALGLAQSAFAVRVGIAPLPVLTRGISSVRLSVFDEEMRRLGEEQARVERALELSSRSQASQTPSRTLELEQELRHVLQQQAYVEERAVAATRGTR